MVEVNERHYLEKKKHFNYEDFNSEQWYHLYLAMAKWYILD